MTPACKAGEAIFANAGYTQLQNAILNADRPPHVPGFSVSPCQLKTKSLFLLKVTGCDEACLRSWHEGAMMVSVKGKGAKTAAVPILINTEDTIQAEKQWRFIFRWFIRYQKTHNVAEKSIFLVVRSEMIRKIGQRLWPQMLLEEKDKMLKNQEHAFLDILAGRDNEIRCLRQKNEELEQLLEKRAQEQSEFSPEDVRLMEQLDRKKLAESIELLCGVREIPWEPMKKTDESGAWQLGYPRYPEGIFEIFQLMESDVRYRPNMDKIRMQKLHISELSLSQIQTYLTYLERGERFCDGVIAEAVEDGRLLKLLLRLQDLVDPDFC